MSLPTAMSHPHPTRYYACGLDVSKGYLDACLLDPSGLRLGAALRFDDTPSGHAALRAWLTPYRDLPDTPLRVGLEATGGLERNWLHALRTFLDGTPSRVYRLHPLAVQRFRACQIHANSTDALAARDIARYLQSGLRHGDQPYEAADTGALIFYRALTNAVDRCSACQNELLGLLPSVQPALVCHARGSVPRWLLHLLIQWPTAPELAAATPAQLAAIPYLPTRLHATLPGDAAQSVGALTDALSGAAVQRLAAEILAQKADAATRKQQLLEHYGADATVQLLASIPGIGPWSAVQLRLEIGDFGRFGSAAALVAYAGLEPRYVQSGDGRQEQHISKRGRSRLRAVLFLAAFAGLRHHPRLLAYRNQLVARGKPGQVALVACMAKLLRIAYACVLSGKAYDPEYEAHRKAAAAAPKAPPATAPAAAAPLPAAPETPRSAAPVPDAPVPVTGSAAARPGTPAGKRGVRRRREPAGQQPEPAPAAPAVGALEAPVSAREARKRRAAARPPAGETRQVRGQAAAQSAS